MADPDSNSITTPNLADRGGGPLLLAATFVVMTAWTWRKWPHVFIDFGRELYVPWQLTLGRSLYSELAYFNGPLSPYVNAALFRVFGIGLTTLMIANLAVLVGVTVLLYRLLAPIAGRLGATLGGFVLLTVFGFSQYARVGNNNYVCPYSHETTHGMLLALAALASAIACARRGRARWRVACGLALGAAFLTKTEVFAAAALACFTALGLHAAVARQRLANVLRDGAIVAAGACVLPAAFVPLVGIDGVLTPWTALLRSDALSNALLRSVMGIDRPWENLGAMLRAGAVVIAALVAAGVIAALIESRRKATRSDALIGFFVLCALCGYAVDPPVLLDTVRALPLGVVAVLIVAASRTIRHRHDADRVANAIATIALGVFSLVMLGKMILNARVYPYGFALAMPGLALVTAVIAGTLPAGVGLGRGSTLRAGLNAALGASLCIAALSVTWHVFEEKTVPVGRGHDRIIAARGDEGPAALAALEVIERFVPPDRTLLVVPEGVMLNYLTRRTNSTPHYNFVPLEMAVAGESRILDDLRRAPPDYVLVVPSFTPRIYGFERFGAPGFGEFIWKWIEQSYDPLPEATPPDSLAAAVGLQLRRYRAAPVPSTVR